ncbi:MAG: CmpA/NrtA family ABC transporter substrate-binding protein [Pseudomonadota bacterium]
MSKAQLTIGFAQLSDCATLVAARERGAFEAHGLDVRLQRFSSWAAMRDALGAGTIDAAHMLSPMVVASAAGLGPFPGQFTTAFTLNLNGNAITVSRALYAEIEEAARETLVRRPLSASALEPLIAKRLQAGDPPLVFAHVFSHSMHAYELRYWLAAGGINPQKDVRLVVIPPERMVDALSSGQIDGYCVGEPWNNTAVVAGIGRTLITTGEIWASAPEKVLAVRRTWADEHTETHSALLSALLETAAWIDRPSHRITAAQMIASPDYVNVPFDEVVGSLTGKNRQTGGELRVDMPDFNVFHRYAANFPWLSHAKWILAQMIRWGDAPDNIDIDVAARAAFQPDFYRKIAGDLGTACPNKDEKIEGAHSYSWVMNDATSPIAFRPDSFIDGRVFDPSGIEEYLAGFTIRSEVSRIGQSDQGQALKLVGEP